MADRPPAPAGLRVSLADGVHVAEGGFDGGGTLLGGSPPRLVRLTATGAARVAAWSAGEPLGASLAELRLARRLLDAGIVHPKPEAGSRQAHVVMPVHAEPDIAPVAALLGDGRPTIVVDDGSAEPVTAAAGIEVVRRDRSAGPASARNEGVRRAVADGAAFVVFVDADVDAHPGWTDALLAHFDDPNVAAVAPRVRAAVGATMLDRYEMTFPSLDRGPHPASVGPGRAVPYVPSAALAVRVAAFDEVGGFDPSLRFGEDVDLVWRLVAAGYTVRYDPSVEVRHRAREDWRGWLTQRRAYGSSAASLAARHGAAVAPARAPAGVYATIGAAVLAPAPVPAAVGAAEIVAAQRRVRASLGEHHDPGLVAGGLARALQSSVLAIVRAGLPFAVLLALSGRRRRRRLVALVVAAAAAEVAEAPASLGRARTLALRLLDHGAYGLGVWEGLVRNGRPGLPAILPRLTRPGVRADAVTADTVPS